ncbi:MAG: tetratricopeptide repeat protein [Candidatus Thermoplasmatota archaeon]|nr:tetratricopeptide repeat protein [Candidatus Thermoplasmatota archaeon]
MDPEGFLHEVEGMASTGDFYWFKSLDGGINDIERAIVWCNEKYLDTGVKIASLIWRYWLYYGYVNRGVDILEASISTAGPRGESLSGALLGLGILHLKQGNLDLAESCLQKSISIAQDSEYLTLVGVCTAMLSRVHTDRGDFERARKLLDESEGLLVENSDYLSRGLFLHARAYNMRISGNIGGAVSAYEKAIGIYREYGDERRVVDEMRNLGTAKFLLGDYEGASSLLLHVGKHRERGIPYFDAYYLIDDAILALISGELSDAENLVVLAEESVLRCEQNVDPDEEMIVRFIRRISQKEVDAS